MSEKLIDPVAYPADAAHQAVIEMAKAGAFNGTSDKGGSFVAAFSKIKACFVELSKNEKGSN
ncbi:hypothetical protein [Morganella morganii]|uniref:hypothetical protein n=1 Tax=Morganella morganii TaxID=582 RepID=UPI001BDAA0E6|nr:hypothetical protein [Morganella morganii]MBT0318708.1 hypothetical protein [Morganella morganii subsp. morganii]